MTPHELIEETARARPVIGRCAVPLGVSLLLLAVPLVPRGQRDQGDFGPSAANLENRGRFIFTRIRYGSSRDGWGERRGTSWSHDYPRADRHLPRILDNLTTMNVALDGSNVFNLDDTELFEHPVAYLSEPDFWTLTESEARSLRSYLLKGGFFIFDDFENEQWDNFEMQIKRVLPEYRLIELDVHHPVFHCFFEMRTIDFPHPLVPVHPRYYGIFDDNDPAKRMLAIVNYNNDLAEYWEWSDTGLFPVDMTNEAYKLGVNYVVYAMTH